MDKTKTPLGVELQEGEVVTEETMDELSNGKGDDNE